MSRFEGQGLTYWAPLRIRYSTAAAKGNMWLLVDSSAILRGQYPHRQRLRRVSCRAAYIVTMTLNCPCFLDQAAAETVLGKQLSCMGVPSLMSVAFGSVQHGCVCVCVCAPCFGLCGIVYCSQAMVQT